MRRLVVLLVTAAVVLVVSGLSADAAFTPNGTEYHPMQFPVQEPVHYFDDFGGVRNHPGNDLMGAKLDHLLAANDGTITWLRDDPTGHTSGNMLVLTGTDGWKYWYLHINNDTPGTDDGKNPPQWRFAPGIAIGAHVKRGQFIAYMGDSGQAETTDPHLHFELHRPDDTYIDPYTSLRLAQGAGANGLCTYPSSPAAHPNANASRGFWTLTRPGLVQAFGRVASYGSPPASVPGASYSAIGTTPTGNGYWVVETNGDVKAFGDARSYGSMAGRPLNAAMTGIAPTPTGHGYWLLGRDGGIFSFGDARFYGSTGGKRLNAPVVSMAATAGGHGYWLLASDGGIFTFGDARFYGSTGSLYLGAPITGMSTTSSGAGYWLVGADGAVFRFGDAAFFGSIPALGWCRTSNALAIAHTSTNGGYWLLLEDGRVIPFGDANAWGQPASSGQRAIAFVAAR